ncbi:hypothetical protein [Rhizobium cremeum]|uniref:hypothetical protein n=1 Tax=Rhizobium cremeum TaxID=2813827 RepID=UPI0013B017DE
MSRFSGCRRRNGYAYTWSGGDRRRDHLYASNVILGVLVVMLLALLATYGLALATTFQA